MTEQDGQIYMRPEEFEKAFVNNTNFKVNTIKEKYDAQPEFAEQRQRLKACLYWANSFTHVMLRRLEGERPEFFDEIGMDFITAKDAIVNNMCLQ